MKYVGLQTSSGQPTKTSKSRTKSRPDSSKNRSSAPKKKREKSQSKTHPENKPDKQEVRLVFMSNRLLLKSNLFLISLIFGTVTYHMSLILRYYTT
jgi:hypothetical protein